MRDKRQVTQHFFYYYFFIKPTVKKLGVLMSQTSNSALDSRSFGDISVVPAYFCHSEARMNTVQYFTGPPITESSGSRSELKFVSSPSTSHWLEH